MYENAVIYNFMYFFYPKNVKLKLDKQDNLIFNKGKKKPQKLLA